MYTILARQEPGHMILASRQISFEILHVLGVSLMSRSRSGSKVKQHITEWPIGPVPSLAHFKQIKTVVTNGTLLRCYETCLYITAPIIYPGKTKTQILKGVTFDLRSPDLLSYKSDRGASGLQ